MVVVDPLIIGLLTAAVVLLSVVVSVLLVVVILLVVKLRQISNQVSTITGAVANIVTTVSPVNLFNQALKIFKRR